jgi:hypothetical protein
MGRSRGGPTSKIQAVVDSRGLPPRLVIQWTDIDDRAFAPAFPLLQLDDPEK